MRKSTRKRKANSKYTGSLAAPEKGQKGGSRAKSPARQRPGRTARKQSPSTTVTTVEIGTAVRKFFSGHGEFDGKVTKITQKRRRAIYLVEYEDGDKEEFTLKVCLWWCHRPPPSASRWAFRRPWQCQ